MSTAKVMRLAIPDMVSPSYFPAIAAAEFGLARGAGVDLELELVFPVSRAAAALRDGATDLVAGPAHAMLYAFPRWDGAAMLAAISRNTFWFLVVRSDLPVARGDLASLRDVKIAAARGPDLGLRQLLSVTGVDPRKCRIDIGPLPPDDKAARSFGLAAAQALTDGRIDAFWANGMAAEIAVRDGSGKVLVDARRDGGPAASFTFSALMTTQTLLDRRPAEVAAVVHALVAAQMRLRDSPASATTVGQRLFPPTEAELIASLVERDAPYYQTAITPPMFSDLTSFARAAGLLDGDVAYHDVVATQFEPLWSSGAPCQFS